MPANLHRPYVQNMHRQNIMYVEGQDQYMLLVHNFLLFCYFPLQVPSSYMDRALILAERFH